MPMASSKYDANFIEYLTLFTKKTQAEHFI